MNALSKDLPANLSTDQSTVDGLDTLFETVDPSVMTVTGDTQPAPDITADIVYSWTLQEAAIKLGLSTRTVLRRLKTGALQGHKVIGINGPEWRIQPLDTKPMTETITKTPVMTVTGDEQSTQDKTTDTTAQVLLKVIESQAAQLKAAADVITYQRSQLEEKDSQIKLLTDSQHKGGWWARFNAWFLGRTNELP